MKRSTKWAIGLGAGVVVVGAAVGVGTLVVNEAVPSVIETQVREMLHLSADHPVEVEVEGVKLADGRLDRVVVRVPDAPIPGGLRADLYAESHSVPTNPTEEALGPTTIGARFSEEQLLGVLSLFSRGISQEISIEQTHLQVTHTISLFGQKIPLSLSLTPSVNEGMLRVEPLAIDAGPFTLTAEQVAGVPLINKLTEGLDICVDDKLPRGITLTDIELSSARVFTAQAHVHPRIGIDEQLRELGTC